MCERTKRKSCHKALVQFKEFVRLLIRQPEDEGEIQNCIGIVFDLVEMAKEIPQETDVEKLTDEDVV